MRLYDRALPLRKLQRSLTEIMEITAALQPDRTAIVYEDESISFRTLLERMKRVAAYLGDKGIQRGDRVAVLLDNRPEFAYVAGGILMAGGAMVAMNVMYLEDEIRYILQDSGARSVFALDALAPRILSVQKDLPALENVVVIGSGLEGCTPFASVLEFPPRENIAHPYGGDLALLQYTSGTTGTPKAVPLTHGNIYAEVSKIQEVMRISDQEVVLSLLPLFHAYSQIVNLWLATIVGAPVVYLKELSSAGIEQGLKESGATALVGVPRLWYLFHKKIWDGVKSRPLLVRVLFRSLLLCNGLLRDWLGLNAGRWFFRTVHQAFGGKLRLAVSGGANFDMDVAKDFHRLGFTILQGYGLTETSGAATVTRFEDNKVGSVGTPLNGVEVKIDQPDDTGVGEVLIRGPVVMSGYYKNPEANREAFTSDGWFRTGDLGRMDKQRHLYIAGRRKDVVKLPSGKNVFPEDVEAHYEQSPFVSEVCVLGVKDETSQFKLAEKLCAVVVPNFEYLRSQHIANAREWVVRAARSRLHPR